MRNIGLILLSVLIATKAQPACNTWIDPHTTMVEIGPSDDLRNAVQQANSGTTIILKPGTYKISSTLQFIKDNVTLRSKTGKKEDVILDGNNGGTPLDPAKFVNEIIAVSASNIILADLTVRYAKHHGIHAYAPSGRNISQLRIRNVRVYDCSQQQIKVNSSGSSPLYFVDEGILECSVIEFVENRLMELLSNYFYVGGIDVHGGWNWIVRNNVFRGFQRNDTLMEAAVHFWNKSRNTLVENNLFVNNYRAITFGTNTSPSSTERKYSDGAGNAPYLDHVDGIIRNNMIFNRKGIHLESGMELTNVATVEVYHNTLFAVDQPFSGIEYRWPNTKVLIANNLSSFNILQRNDAQATLTSNLVNVPAKLFFNALEGELHLVASATTAINQGVVLAAGKADQDFDRQNRELKPDIGADEYSLSIGIRKAKSKIQQSSLLNKKVVWWDPTVLISGNEFGKTQLTWFTLTGQKYFND